MSIELKKVDDLAFFCKITANVTHELTNVLSIINEFNGLLEDQVYNLNKSKTIQTEKLDLINKKINIQIERGQSLIKNLNYFSHSIDYQISEFDVIRSIKNIITLSKRFASLKFIDIAEFYEIEKYVVNSNMFNIQKLIFNILTYLFENLDEKSKIKIHATKDNVQLLVKITSNKLKLKNENEEGMNTFKEEMLKISNESGIDFTIDYENFELKIQLIIN